MLKPILSKTIPFWETRAYYFLFYAALACVLPYLSLYYKSLGMDGQQIGLLAGLPAIITVLSTPFWTGMADAQRCHRQIYLLNSVGTLLCILALGKVKSFSALLITVLLYAMFFSALMPLVDNTVMAQLGEQRARYGKLRMWGAVGWGVMAPLMGWVTGIAGLRFSFWGFGLLFLMTILVGVRLPLDIGHSQEPFWHGVKQLLGNKRLLRFLGLVFAGGMAQTTVHSFLFLYIADMRGSNILMGIALTVSTLSEIPLLFFGDRLLHRLGARGLLVVSMVAYALRLLLYALNSSAWLVLPIQLLHGLTFSSMWIAGYLMQTRQHHPGWALLRRDYSRRR